MATTTIDGLVTGLDTTKIIDGLLSVQSSRIALLQNKEDKTVKQQTAFKSVEAKLLALQSDIGALGRAQNGAFDGKLVSSSDEDLLTAAASSRAAPGVYSLRVNSLARAHQIASQGFDDPDSTITEGTFAIRIGSGATTTITIDGTNNTLSGLATAINDAGLGVTATIVDDGSESQPYRLVLSSSKTGAANAITITNGLGVDASGARRPELSSTYIGNAVTSENYSGTATVTANSGAGGYTGTATKTYTFTVRTGGTVGVTDGILVDYDDGAGGAGTITLNAGDQDTFKAVAEGIQIKLGAGTLTAGDTFSVDAFAPTVQQAANASVTLGSGSGALTAQSDTNHVDGLVGGVTLDLHAADPGQEIQLTIANDKTTAEKAIGSFVDSYNDLMSFIDQQVQYDAASNTAGVLLGNRSVTVIQDQVRRVAGELVSGVNGQANRLGAIGISTNDSGQLVLDQSKLDAVLGGNVEGVSFDDVRRLFALAGQSTSGGVQFVVGGVRTKASTTPYQVDISQAAERAAATATNPLAASTVIDNSNDSLLVTIDGRTSSTVKLTAGTYTKLGLARELEAQINANDQLAGRRVAVSLDPAGDRLVITSATYGTASEVTIGAGTALAALGLSGTESDRGQDVAGKFVVDGVEEPAVGTGQFLVGNADNANTADLQVRVTLGAAQVVAGPEASVSVTRGIASKLDVALSALLDPVSGRLKTVNDGFQDTIDDLENSVKKQNDLMNLQREALVRQFAALESTVSKLKTTGDFLSAQLQVPTISKKSS